MKRAFEVVWSEVARSDLTRIVDYISRENPATAAVILGKIKDRASSLYFLPYKGRIVPEFMEQGLGEYRELIVAPWRIIFRIEKKKVLVLSVLDARRNIEDVLLQRMIEL